MQIYAPNHGSLNISLLSKDTSFSYNTIYSGISTKSLTIDCQNNGMKCTKNIIHAQDSQSLNYLCDSYCDSTTIHCPIDNDTDCNIFCQNSCNNLVIDAPNHNNLDFICDKSECKDSVISCNINNTMYQSHFTLPDDDDDDDDEEEEIGTMIGACSSDTPPIIKDTQSISTSLKINIYYNDSFDESESTQYIDLYRKSMALQIMQTYEMIRKNDIQYQQVSMLDLVNISFCVMFNQLIPGSNKCGNSNNFDSEYLTLTSSKFIATAILEISTNYDIDITANTQYVIDTIESDIFSEYFQQNMNIQLSNEFKCADIDVEDYIISMNDESSNDESVHPIDHDDTKLTKRYLYSFIITGIVMVVICSIGLAYILHRWTNSRVAKIEHRMRAKGMFKRSRNNVDDGPDNIGTKHRRLSSVCSKSKSSLVGPNGLTLRNRNSIDDELCSIEEETKQRKRSFHWGFTDGGDEKYGEKYGEIKDKSPSPFVQLKDDKSGSSRHRKRSNGSYSRRHINNSPNPRLDLKRRMTENSIPEEIDEEQVALHALNEITPVQTGTSVHQTPISMMSNNISEPESRLSYQTHGGTVTMKSSPVQYQYQYANQNHNHNLNAYHSPYNQHHSQIHHQNIHPPAYNHDGDMANHIGHHPKSTRSVSSIEIEDLFTHPLHNNHEGTSIEMELGHTSSMTSAISYENDATITKIGSNNSKHTRSNNNHMNSGHSMASIPSATFIIKPKAHSKHYERSKSSIEKMDDDLDDWDPRTATELPDSEDSSETTDSDTDSDDNDIEPCVKNSNSDFGLGSLSSVVGGINQSSSPQLLADCNVSPSDTPSPNDIDNENSSDTISHHLTCSDESLLDHYGLEQRDIIEPEHEHEHEHKMSIDSGNHLNVNGVSGEIRIDELKHDVFSTETGPDLPLSPSTNGTESISNHQNIPIHIAETGKVQQTQQTQHEQTIIDVEDVLNKDLDLENSMDAIKQNNGISPKSNDVTIGTVGIPSFAAQQSCDSHDTHTTDTTGSSATSQPKTREHHRNILSISQAIPPNYWD